VGSVHKFNLVDIQPKLRPQGSSPSRPNLKPGKVAAASSNVASQQKSTPRYVNFVNSARQPCATKLADESVPASADGGFISVIGKRKNVASK
jgi:hypothetical protein